MNILDQALASLSPTFVGWVCMVIVFVFIVERLVQSWKAWQEGLLAQLQRSQEDSPASVSASSDALERLVSRVGELEKRALFQRPLPGLSADDLRTLLEARQVPVRVEGLQEASLNAEEVTAAQPERHVRRKNSDPGTSSSGGEPSPRGFHPGTKPPTVPRWDHATSASTVGHEVPRRWQQPHERFPHLLAAA